MKRSSFILLIISMSIIIIFYTSTVFAADLGKVDAAGSRFLTIVRRIGYWIILGKAIQEVIRAAMAGDTRSIGSIVLKYVLMYGALFFLPWALRLVEGIF